MYKIYSLCWEWNFIHSSVDFGRENFHLRAIFRSYTLLDFVSDIFMMPCALPLPWEVISNPSFKTLIFFSPSWSLLGQRAFWPQANHRQLKYLIIDKSYSGSRVHKEFRRRNGKFCRSISSEGSTHLLHSSGALVTEQLLTVLDGFFFLLNCTLTQNIQITE